MIVDCKYMVTPTLIHLLDMEVAGDIRDNIHQILCTKCAIHQVWVRESQNTAVTVTDQELKQVTSVDGSTDQKNQTSLCYLLMYLKVEHDL